MRMAKCQPLGASFESEFAVKEQKDVVLSES